MDKPIKHVALDYFPEFKCLADKCNYTCCYQWDIDINRPDYMKVKNLRVGKEMQQLISTGIKRVKNHPRGYYARIVNRKDGNCPFLGQDRLCQLQQECGYNALPKVCKEFPRFDNTSPVQWEQYCSTGCEQVVKLLLARPQGLRMIELNTKEKPLMNQEYAAEKISRRPALQFYQEIQMLFMGILQNRRYSLSHRMLLVGLASQQLNKVETTQQAVEFLQKSLSLLEYDPSMERQLNELQKDTIGGVLTVFKQMITQSIKKENEVRDEFFDDMMESVYKNLNVQLNINENAKGSLIVDSNAYQIAKKHFKNIPETEYLMENVMVNLMIYSQFPIHWINDRTSVWENYLDFAIQHNIFFVLCSGYMADKTDVEKLVQCITTCSRSLMHNSNFRRLLIEDWKKRKMDTLAHIAYLMG